jgi:hypothetical protein
LIGDNRGTNLAEAPIGSPSAAGNLIGGPMNGVINPQLGPLTYNGGPVLADGSPMLTHALVSGSPAIDAGDPAAMPGTGVVPLYDQRGMPFSRVVDGDGMAGARIDMGSYERQESAPFHLFVDTLADELDGDYSSGDFSLREAVEIANLNPDADEISFAPSLTAGGPAAILLTMSELQITDSVKLNGPGSELLTIDAQSKSRIFNISATAGDFTITGLTITGGQTTGANTAGMETTYSGGGIRSLTTGQLTIGECTITDNRTAGNGAAGGGVFALGPVVIVASIVSNNTGAADGGGISSQADVSVNECVVAQNHAGLGGGGGISARGHVVIDRSVVSGNTTTGIVARGGGAYSTQGNITVASSAITDNRTMGNQIEGGGIATSFSTSGTVTITNSTISGNNTTGPENSGNVGGGGVFAIRVVIRNSTISGNSTNGSPSGHGGGVLASLMATITNSTVFDNHANHQNSPAGGVAVLGGSLSILNSIIAGNTAGRHSDIFKLGQTSARYSIIGSNDGTDLAEAPLGAPDANGNLIGGPVNGAIDPQLGPLTYNGGPMLPDGTPMLTHGVLPGSPALDAGDPSAVAGINGVPLYDQRGMPFSRIANGDDVPEATIDIGAFEWQPNPLPGDYNYSGVVDAADYVLWRKSLESNGDLRADGDGDADVDQDDYAVWRANFGAVAASSPAASAMAVQHPGKGDESVANPKPRMPFDTSANTVGRRSESLRVARQRTDEVANVNDEALLAWLAGMTSGDRISQLSTTVAFSDDQSRFSADNSLELDVVFAVVGSDGL